MMWIDIALLLMTVVFVTIGIWKGFLKLIIKLGAVVPAVVLSRAFGGFLGVTLFPSIIGKDSAIAKKVSYSALENINTSLAKVIGTLILFIVLFIIFKIILGVISNMVKKEFKVSLVDRLLGGVFGLVIALGAAYAVAFAVNIVAMVITLIDSANPIYASIEDTVIFKYFF